MADLSDVQNVLVAQIAQAIYPNGTAQASVTGAATKIYPGWPDPATLDADMAAGLVHVSVFGLMSRHVTPMQDTWQVTSVTASQLVATVSGFTVTLTGTITTPQAVSVQQGSVQASYTVQPTDTLTSICTALAAMIPGATSSGNTLTLPVGVAPTVGFAVPASMLREVGRQVQTFQVSVWAPNPGLRAATAAALDPALRAAYRQLLPDGTQCGVRFVGSADDDDLSKRALFVRHLRYDVEYPTMQSETTTTVTLPVTNLGVSLSPL